MADNQTKSGASLPWANIMALLVAAGGMLSLVPSLRTSRPPDPGGQSMPVFGEQTVDSRLWQDPFEEVMKNAKNAKRDEKTGEIAGEEHGLKALKESMNWKQRWPNQLKVMIVMMKSGPHAESRERRLRTRIAVVEGLAASGYAPSDSEHLGYLHLAWPRHSYKIFDNPAADELEKPAKADNYENIPFESFEQKGEHKGLNSVVVLYIQEAACQDRPFTRLAYLSRALELGGGEGGNKRKVPTTVLGPATSTILERMVNELGEFDPSDENRTDLKATHQLVRQQLRGMQIFCPTATASFKDENNIDDKVSEWIQAQFKDEHLIFQRTIPTDGEIVSETIKELRRRGVDPTDHQNTWVLPEANGKAKDPVAIITELDSYHGRALPTAFVQYCANVNLEDPVGAAKVPWIHSFYYLRGLDGLLPGDTKKAGDTAGKEEQKRSPGARPDGHDQTDSLLRLADLLASKDRELRNKGEPGFRAIGVLGSDVYDKLLILRALRPMFPGVIFFTNNLDAQLSQPEEWAAAHNLVVVSAFGLELHKKWQRNFPPFRDSYQTATFLGTLVAMGTADPHSLAKVMDVPRVFEIGRNGALDLSVNTLGAYNDNTDGTRTFGNAQVKERDQNGHEIIRIHPLRTDLKQWWSSEVKHLATLGAWSGILTVPVSLGLGILSALIFALIFYRATVSARPQVPAGDAAPKQPSLLSWVERNYPLGSVGARHLHSGCEMLVRGSQKLINVTVRSTLVAGVIAAIIAVLFVSLGYRTQWIQGEPFAWFEGLSIWPGAAIRIFAIILGIHFIDRICGRVRKSDSEIFERFSLTNKREECAAARIPFRSWIHTFAPWTVPLSREERPAGLDSAVVFREESFDARELWCQYVWRDWWPHRLARVGTLTLLFLLTGWFTFAAFDGGFAASTGRSLIARWCDTGSTILLLATATFVTLFVADALLLNASFIRLFNSGFTRWPDEVLKRSGFTGVLSDSEITEELDVQLIATRTATIGEFVLYPFIIVALLVVSRAPYFDDWGWTVGLIIVLAAILGIAVVAARSMRNSAEKARKGALERLRAARNLAATNAATEKKVPFLDKMIERINNMDQGAFAPLSQQPIIKALLFPAGGIGMWEIARQLLGKL